MDFKYYHGTSTIFLDSIQKTGLGGVNPNFDYKNLEVLKFLYNQSEQHLLNNPKYQNLRETSKAMANQDDYKIWVDGINEEIIHNYKHDCIYLGLSKIRAVIYASTNRYGSEILERCLVLYQMLLDKLPDLKIPPDLNLFQIERYLQEDPKPIIIEIINLDDKLLKTELDEDPTDLLYYLRYILPYKSEKEQFEFPQLCNFKLLKPVPCENLRFYALEFDGHPNDQQNFEWTLHRL